MNNRIDDGIMMKPGEFSLDQCGSDAHACTSAIRSKTRLSTLGTISASDQKSAIDKAAAVFHITPASRSKLVVTKIVVPPKRSNKSPDHVEGRS